MRDLKTLMDMSGRRALITGGAGTPWPHHGGQPRGTGRGNPPRGCGGARRPERWPTISPPGRGVRVIALDCDLELAEARSDLVAQVQDTGGLSVLINNAAFVGTSGLTGWAEPLERQSVETWRRALEVNLTAGFHLCQLCAPVLKGGPSGSIINIASIYGQWGPDYALYEGTAMASPAAYGASKGRTYPVHALAFDHIGAACPRQCDLSRRSRSRPARKLRRTIHRTNPASAHGDGGGLPRRGGVSRLRPVRLCHRPGTGRRWRAGAFGKPGKGATMISLFKRLRFWCMEPRIGADIPLTHWMLHFPGPRPVAGRTQAGALWRGQQPAAAVQSRAHRPA